MQSPTHSRTTAEVKAGQPWICLPSLENCQGWRILSLPGQPFSMPHCPPPDEASPKVQPEPPKVQYVPLLTLSATMKKSLTLSSL